MADKIWGSGTGKAGPRRLIAGLRVTAADEQLLAVVRPFFAETDSAGELAYRLWRRGLEITLAELLGTGAALPPVANEEVIATLAAQRLLLCLPLLRRTGRLAALGIEPVASLSTSSPSASADSTGIAVIIDDGAGEVIASLGASEFL